MSPGFVVFVLSSALLIAGVRIVFFIASPMKEDK